jgi:hypothetical protein
LGLICPLKEGEGSVGADQCFFFFFLSIFFIPKFWRHLTHKFSKIIQVCTRKGKISQNFPISKNFPISSMKNLPQKKTTGVDLV